MAPPPRVEAEVAALTRELRALGTVPRAVHEKAYLKSRLEFYGATVPAIRSVAKDFVAKKPDLDRRGLLSLVKALWNQPVHELHMVAIELLDLRKELLQAEDLARCETMLRTSHTWAYVDSLAASVVGSLVVRYPQLTDTLDRWAKDQDFWIRRSAMLALLLPLRRGEGDMDRFLRYADGMLQEKEFFIRKSIGWVLRESARKRPEVVRDFLGARLDRVSGLTLREGSRHLPAADRDALLEAFRQRKTVLTGGHPPL